MRDKYNGSGIHTHSDTHKHTFAPIYMHIYTHTLTRTYRHVNTHRQVNMWVFYPEGKYKHEKSIYTGKYSEIGRAHV